MASMEYASDSFVLLCAGSNAVLSVLVIAVWLLLLAADGFGCFAGCGATR